MILDIDYFKPILLLFKKNYKRLFMLDLSRVSNYKVSITLENFREKMKYLFL